MEETIKRLKEDEQEIRERMLEETNLQKLSEMEVKLKKIEEVRIELERKQASIKRKEEIEKRKARLAERKNKDNERLTENKEGNMKPETENQKEIEKLKERKANLSELMSSTTDHKKLQDVINEYNEVSKKIKEAEKMVEEMTKPENETQEREEVVEQIMEPETENQKQIKKLKELKEKKANLSELMSSTADYRKLQEVITEYNQIVKEVEEAEKEVEKIMRPERERQERIEEINGLKAKKANLSKLMSSTADYRKLQDIITEYNEVSRMIDKMEKEPNSIYNVEEKRTPIAKKITTPSNPEELKPLPKLLPPTDETKRKGFVSRMLDKAKGAGAFLKDGLKKLPDMLRKILILELEDDDIFEDVGDPILAGQVQGIMEKEERKDQAYNLRQLVKESEEHDLAKRREKEPALAAMHKRREEKRNTAPLPNLKAEEGKKSWELPNGEKLKVVAGTNKVSQEAAINEALASYDRDSRYPIADRRAGGRELVEE